MTLSRTRVARALGFRASSPVGATVAKAPAVQRSSITLFFVAAISGAIIPGCASWDSGTYFPEDYEATYTKAHACKKGAHPAGDYVITWVNPVGKQAFEKGTTPSPEGTIFVKSQFTDKNCTDQSRFTVMKKGPAGTATDKGDWLWQLIDNSGGVAECCDGSNNCVSCHTPCKTNDWVCTQPTK